MPERIQRRRVKGWRMPEGAVYVGRGSKWGNPFVYRNHRGLVRYRPAKPNEWEYEGRISADGARHDMHHPGGLVEEVHVRYATRREVVTMYERTLTNPDQGMIGAYPSNGGHLVTYREGADKRGFGGTLVTVTPAMIRAELAGKDLACWCAPEHPCHVDVLLRIANTPAEVAP